MKGDKDECLTKSPIASTARCAPRPSPTPWQPWQVPVALVAEVRARVRIGNGGLGGAVGDARSGRRPRGPAAGNVPPLFRPRGKPRFGRTQRTSLITSVTRTATTAGDFINQSPGCRQGAILAPDAAWLRVPGSGGSRLSDILDRSATRGFAASRLGARMPGLEAGRTFGRLAIVTVVTAAVTVVTAPVTAVTAITRVAEVTE